MWFVVLMLLEQCYGPRQLCEVGDDDDESIVE